MKDEGAFLKSPVWMGLLEKKKNNNNRKRKIR